MKLVVGERHQLFIDSLAAVLAWHGFDVAAVATTPRELLATVAGLQPPFRQHLPGLVHLLTCRRLPGTESAVSRTRQLLLGESVDYLMTVVSGTLGGETWIPPRLLTRVLAELKARRHRAEHEQSLAALTKREKEVLSCLVSGMTG